VLVVKDFHDFEADIVKRLTLNILIATLEEYAMKPKADDEDLFYCYNYLQ
jgi:hypothetical protein